MSDQNSTPITGNENPNTGDGGQSGGQNNETPNENNSQQAGSQQPEPFRAFASQKELNEFMADRVQRAEKSALEKQAKAHGFKSWEHAQAYLAILNGEEPADDADDKQAGNQNDGVNEAQRLRMALKIGAELNLPTALVERLQGDTEDEMKADAERLLAFLTPQQSNRGPGVPPTPRDQNPVTFTVEQMNDPEFVRKNRDAILQAVRNRLPR